MFDHVSMSSRMDGYDGLSMLRITSNLISVLRHQIGRYSNGEIQQPWQ